MTFSGAPTRIKSMRFVCDIEIVMIITYPCKNTPKLHVKSKKKTKNAR